VPEDEIDKRYYERPYYIAPDDKSGQEAFAVIRDAMKDKGRVALARIVFANREHILAVEPWEKGMLGTTLRYEAAGHTIEPPPEEPAPSNVINLMDALRESMKRKKPSNLGRSTNRRKSVGSAGRRETARRKAG
jgi:non-homologous end joining protein Ku